MRQIIRIMAVLAVFAALGGGALLGWSDSAQAEEVSIEVDDFYFCSDAFNGAVCETTITEGDTVVWESAGNVPHTTTGSIWDSGTISPGGTFSFTFDEAGSYEYHCNIHPSFMLGRIIVEAGAAEPTATSSSSGGETPGPDATATRTGGTTLPRTGQGPSDGSTSWWLFAIVATAGVALSAAGGWAYTRRRV